ncbi:MAG: hypothetical protein GY930_13035 [bacterium]|nr:hypothetical protein [bacterium]
MTTTDNMEGMISFPESAKRGIGRNLLIWFVLLTNAGLVLGTLAIDLVDPLEHPKLIGREKIADDLKRENASVWDGSLARLFEYDYRIESRVRKYVSRPYSEFLLEYLKETKSGILLGAEGWLFTKARAIYPRMPDDLPAKRGVAIYGAVARRLKSLGIRHVLVPIPRKSVVSEDLLPFWVNPDRCYDEAIPSVFQARGLEAVDLLPVFDAWDGVTLYRATDTHWSTSAMNLAAEESARFLGHLQPEGMRVGRLVDGGKSTLQRPGGLARNLEIRLDPEDPRNFDRGNLQVIFTRGEGTKGSGGERFALCGTSFSTDTFESFLSHYFGERFGLYARGGSSSFLLVEDLLESHRGGPYPEVVLQESPVHQLLALARASSRWSLPKGWPGIILDNAPVHVETIPLSTHLLSKGLKLGSKFQIGPKFNRGKGRYLAALDKGWLAHSGDGVVESYCDIELVSGEAKISIRSGAYRFDVPLSEGRRVHYLPILADNPDVQEVQLSILAPKGAEVILHDTRMVSSIDIRTRAEGTLGPNQDSGGEPSQVVTFEGKPVLQRQSTLVMRLKGEGTELGPVTIDMRDESGEVCLSYQFDHIRAGASIALNLGKMHGKSLRSVAVRGAGLATDGALLNAYMCHVLAD